MITTFQTDQQVIRLHSRHRGLAWVIVDQFTDQQLARGDTVNGVQYGPVPFMFIILAMRFAPNVDEARARALKRWGRFSRQPNESIKSMYVRFKIGRKRVAEEAGLQIPWGLQAEKIIFMRPVPRHELLKLLEPLQYRVPSTQVELGSFVQTRIHWEEMNSRHILGNL